MQLFLQKKFLKKHRWTRWAEKYFIELVFHFNVSKAREKRFPTNLQLLFFSTAHIPKRKKKIDVSLSIQRESWRCWFFTIGAGLVYSVLLTIIGIESINCQKSKNRIQTTLNKFAKMPTRFLKRSQASRFCFKVSLNPKKDS